MQRRGSSFRYFAAALLIFATTVPVFSDEAFDKLIESKSFSEALSYVDKKIPTTGRDAGIWVKLGVTGEDGMNGNGNGEE